MLLLAVGSQDVILSEVSVESSSEVPLMGLGEDNFDCVVIIDSGAKMLKI